MSQTKEQREAMLKTGEPVYKQFVVDTQALEGRRVRFIVTTQDPDRERDVVETPGIETEAFEKNPVVLFAHNYRELPVGRCVEIERHPSKLVATCEFATEDLNPKAEMVYRMVKAGFLNATSIGFRPLEWNYNEERRGIDFKRVELLEYSIVPVPANSMALIAAGADGIDSKILKDWAEETLRALDEAEAETKAEQPSIEELARQDECKAPFDRDPVGWKAFVKARQRAAAKADGVLGTGAIAQMLDDYGFEDEAKALPNEEVKDEAKDDKAPETMKPDAGGKCKPGYAMGGDGMCHMKSFKDLAAEVIGLRVELDSVGKAGRVLSKANESKLREATDAIARAQEQIAEVLKAVEKDEQEQPVETPAPAVEASVSDDTVVLLSEIEEDELLLVDEEEKADAELVEFSAADLEGAIRSALNDVVRRHVSEEIAALRGRID